MKKVFLGGTCNNSTWRDELIPMLKVYYFNPVVANWTPECQAEELRQRESCDYCLYVITPEMTGVYSIAEVTDDSNKRPHKTLFCFLSEANGKEFDKPQIKSLQATSKLIEENGAKVFESLKEVAEWINSSHLIPSDSDLTYEVDSNGTERWYDTRGNVTHYKGSSGYEEWYEYDSNGNKTHSKNSNGYEKWYDYDSNGNKTHSKNSNGYEYWYEYDSNGKLTHFRTSSGYEEWYDTRGNVTHSR